MAVGYYRSTKETYINDAFPDTSYGDGDKLNLYYRLNRSEERTLLEFDLSQLPSFAAIEDATLTLNFSAVGKATNFAPQALGQDPDVAIQPQWSGYELRFMLQSFNDSTATWNRYRRDRSEIHAATTSTSTSTSSSASVESVDHLHEWPGGAGARGDTIDDGAVTGKLPSETGDFTINIRDLVTYAFENNSEILTLYLARLLPGRSGSGRWQIVSGNARLGERRVNTSSSSPSTSSSSSADRHAPLVKVWWHPAASSEAGTSDSV